jgi:O-antigen/teichoic acid export membrane protein
LEMEAGGDRRGVIAVWMNSIRKMALLTFPFVAWMFVVKSDLIPLLFTTTYRDAIPLFGIHILGSAIILLLTEPILRTFSEMRYFSLKLSLVMLPLTGIGLYAGIRAAGLTGAMIAVVSIRLLAAGATVTAIFRKLRIQRREGYDFGIMLARPALSAAVGALIVLAIQSRLEGAPLLLRLAAGSVLFWSVFAVLAALTRTIQEDEKQFLRLALRQIVSRGCQFALKVSRGNSRLARRVKAQRAM